MNVVFGLVAPAGMDVEEVFQENREALIGSIDELKLEITGEVILDENSEGSENKEFFGKILTLSTKFPHLAFDVIVEYEDETTRIHRFSNGSCEILHTFDSESTKTKQVGSVHLRYCRRYESITPECDITLLFTPPEERARKCMNLVTIGSSQRKLCSRNLIDGYCLTCAPPGDGVIGSCTYVFVRGMRQGQTCGYPCSRSEPYCHSCAQKRTIQVVRVATRSNESASSCLPSSSSHKD